MNQFLKRNQISLAVKRVLYAGIAGAVLISPMSHSEEANENEEAEAESNQIVITGSRLQRQTYTSLAPLQVITAEASREAGLIDAADIIQGAGASSGQQIDLTFSGFVLDNGPGASTANLRGLGSARTLTLVNGRRLAPSGVEGAPAAADLNLVPASLVQQYELLLDGASSIYGSDAVAGVANIILKQDFDGFTAELFSETPEQDNGQRTTLSLSWGQNYDRGFIGFGAEYVDQEEIRLKDRRWTDQCDRHVEITTTGEIRNQDLFYPRQGQRVDSRGCKGTSGLVGRVIVPGAGSIYYTPGFSNGGWGDWSESSSFGVGIDSDGDGVNDVSFVDYSLNGADASQNAHLVSRQERISVMSYGEYTFDGDMNVTPYFEVGFNKRDFFTDGGAPQLFPFVPADNPFNLCNPNAPGGVDCGLALDALYNNPALYNGVADVFGCTIFSGGTCDQTGGAIGPQELRIVAAVKGDRSEVNTTMEQSRVVLGFKGDLPQLSFGEMTDWQFDAFLSFTESKGTSSRMGVRQDRLDQALSVVETSPGSGVYECTDTSNGCVPVNLLSPTLYNPLVGDFATQAERDFLFDSRDFDTTYKQTIFSAFLNGVFTELPAGAMTGGIGFEYRKDDIASIPDDIARDGLFFGFFSDGGAEGSKDTKEYFAEVEIPVFANAALAEELTVNLSARTTKDEFYGSNTTYSTKIGYRPFESLLIRGSKGTSYRAPNVRENFLRGQTGFNGIFDPCAIPDSATNPLTGGYDASLDEREAHVLANCLANGVDPTTLAGNGNNVYSTEIESGGVLGLNEEKSDSLNYGFAWEQPFTNEFDLTIGTTWWEIEINDTIVEPSGQFIVNDCYNSVNGASTFCGRIGRDADGYLDLLNAGFLNRDNETVRGVDVNINFETTAVMFEYPIKWNVDIVATHTKEASTLFTTDDGGVDYDDDAGEFGYPKWKASVQIAASYDKWRVTWQSLFIDEVEQDPAGIDEFDTIDGNSDTCLGGLGGVECRDVGFADHYVRHTFSAYYYADSWKVGLGVRNVFDKEPPVVDGSEVLASNNTPIGAGYDLNGRTIFLNVSKNFN